jgi:long-chain fatty acid transport protein
MTVTTTVRCRAISMLTAALSVAGASAHAQQLNPGGTPTLSSATTGSGARALGMGGAFIAIADDASAASWNPAGLALVDGRQVSLAGDLTRIADSIPSYESTTIFGTGLRVVESGPGISTTRTSRSPAFANIVYPFRIRAWRIVPQFSYRRAANANVEETATRPYQYSESTGFRETGSDVRTLDAGRGLDVYSGAVGVGIARMLDLGVAINLWRGGSAASDSRSINGTFSFAGAGGALNPSSYVTTYDEAFRGTSVDAGVLFKPFRRLRIGAVVKEGFTLERTYDYTRQYANWVGSISSETYRETGTIEWPRSAGVGLAVMPFEMVTVSTDYTRSSWSEADYRFTSSDVQVINGRSTMIQASGVVVYPQLYDPSAPVQPYFNVPQLDSWQLRGGAEAIWRRPGAAIAEIPLRAGVYRSVSFVPQSNGDERRGIGVTAGAGVAWGQFKIDIAYIRESTSGKTHEFPMTALSGFSQSQLQGGLETTVVSRLLLSVAASF